MIIHSFDDKTEALVSLKDFYGERGNFCDTCLIIFSSKIFYNLKETYYFEKRGEIHAVNGNTNLYTFSYKEKRIGCYLSQIGSTLCSQCMIEASWILGCQNFIMFGSCGSLDAEKTKGKYIIPIEAYRDEGMSYHYAPPTDYIKVRNSHKLAKIFDELCVPYVRGKVWTTDAFFRETVGQIRERKKEGCIAVEMELAGAQAVADFYGFELYAFLEAGDVLSENEYSNNGLRSANHDISKLHIALEAASLIENDIKLYKPHFEDLWYREKLVNDVRTMYFNGGNDGTFPFGHLKWKCFFDKWVNQNEYRYFYIVDKNGEWVGEVTCTDYENGDCSRVNIIVKAEKRKNGIGSVAYALLCEVLRKDGIRVIEVDVQGDNPIVYWLEKNGFLRVATREDSSLYRKNI